MVPVVALSVAGRTDNLPAAMQFLQNCWQTAQLPQDQLFYFELVLEEIFVNIAVHGSGPDRPPQVEIRIGVADDAVSLTIADDGAAFDPLGLPPPDLETPMAHRAVGGLGVHLVREMMDSLAYGRRAGRNELTMSRKIR